MTSLQADPAANRGVQTEESVPATQELVSSHAAFTPGARQTCPADTMLAQVPDSTPLTTSWRFAFRQLPDAQVEPSRHASPAGLSVSQMPEAPAGSWYTQ